MQIRVNCSHCAPLKPKQWKYQMHVAPHHSTHAPQGKFNGKLETFHNGAKIGVWCGSVAVFTEHQMAGKGASCANHVS